MSRSFGAGEEFCVIHSKHVKKYVCRLLYVDFFLSQQSHLKDWSLCGTAPINHVPFRQRAVDASCPFTFALVQHTHSAHAPPPNLHALQFVPLPSPFPPALELCQLPADGVRCVTFSSLRFNAVALRLQAAGVPSFLMRWNFFAL
jgi:hypothetical protein